MPPTTTMVTSSTERRKPASSGVMKRSALANKEPLSAAITAESTKMRALSAAVSSPAVCAAISESASARKPRPNAERIRLSDRKITITSTAATIQYQVCGPRSFQAKICSTGTEIPSGPPVNSISRLITIETMMPRPNVAMAR